MGVVLATGRGSGCRRGFRLHGIGLAKLACVVVGEGWMGSGAWYGWGHEVGDFLIRQSCKFEKSGLIFIAKRLYYSKI